MQYSSINYPNQISTFLIDSWLTHTFIHLLFLIIRPPIFTWQRQIDRFKVKGWQTGVETDVEPVSQTEPTSAGAPRCIVEAQVLHLIQRHTHPWKFANYPTQCCRRDEGKQARLVGWDSVLLYTGKSGQGFLRPDVSRGRRALSKM